MQVALAAGSSWTATTIIKRPTKVMRVGLKPEEPDSLFQRAISETNTDW